MVICMMETRVSWVIVWLVDHVLPGLVVHRRPLAVSGHMDVCRLRA